MQAGAMAGKLRIRELHDSCILYEFYGYRNRRYSTNDMHPQGQLIVRIIFRHCTGNAIVLRLAALEVALGRSRRYNSHVPVPHGTPLAVVDLKVHGVGVQGVIHDEILQDLQGGIVDAPGQMLVVGVSREDLDLGDAGFSGYLRGDGNPPGE